MPRSYPRRSRSTPNRTWAGINAAVFTNVPAATKVLLGSFTLNNNGIDETVLWTVGSIAIKSDQAAASEDQIGAFGLYVVSNRALAIGLSAIPGPVTNASEDGWFVWQGFAQSFEFASGVGVEAQMMTQYPFDSKAKRVVGTGMGIAIMVENAHATHGFDIGVPLRLLSMVRGTG